MSDLISRQSVLEEIDRASRKYSASFFKGLSIAADIVTKQPPAERPKGKWIIGIKRPSIGTQCDACGWAWSANIDAVKLEPCLALIKTRYCPNCGAEMEMEE